MLVVVFEPLPAVPPVPGCAFAAKAMPPASNAIESSFTIFIVLSL